MEITIPGIYEKIEDIKHTYNNYICSECHHNCTHSYQYREYYDNYSRCRACGKKFEDYDDGDDYDGCNHDYELVEEAVDCEDGDEYMCKYCGDTYTTEPVGHSFLAPGDPCERCGAENPQQNGDGTTYCQHGNLWTECYYCNN